MHDILYHFLYYVLHDLLFAQMPLLITDCLVRLQHRCRCLCCNFQIVPKLAGLVVATYGFGYNLLVTISTVVLCSWLLVYWKRYRLNLVDAIGIVVLIIVGVFNPAIWQCTSLVILLLLIVGLFDIVFAVAIASVVPTICFVLPVRPSVMLSIWTLTCIYVGAIFVFAIAKKRHQLLGKLLMVFAVGIYGVGLIFWASRAVLFEKCLGRSVPYGYQIGDALEKVIGTKIGDKGGLYFDNIAETDVAAVGTLYLDHDSKTIYEDCAFLQRTPWSSNSLVAAEPFRVALAKDGALLWNKGCSLSSDRVKPLWGQYGENGFSVLCGIDKTTERMVIGDADFSCNLLTPYQYHFIRRMAGVDCEYKVWIVIVGCFMILLPVVFFAKTERRAVLSGFFIFSVLGFLFVFPDCYDKGGVRYEGRRILYPHTTTGTGVVRAMQKVSKNVLFTSRDALILAVGRNAKAVHKGERVVVLEPGAKVAFQSGEVAVAGELPMGRCGNVVDARQISLSDKGVAEIGVCEVDGILVYASGSPAELDFKEILK